MVRAEDIPKFLSSPSPYLGDKSPEELLHSDEGLEKVLKLLKETEDGSFN